jgi:hypothetical protein
MLVPDYFWYRAAPKRWYFKIPVPNEMVLKIPKIPVPNEMVLENPGTKRLFGTIQGWDFFNGGNHLFITQKKTKSRRPAPSGTSRRHKNPTFI